MLKKLSQKYPFYNLLDAISEVNFHNFVYGEIHWFIVNYKDHYTVMLVTLLQGFVFCWNCNFVVGEIPMKLLVWFIFIYIYVLVFLFVTIKRHAGCCIISHSFLFSKWSSKRLGTGAHLGYVKYPRLSGSGIQPLSGLHPGKKGCLRI